MTQFYTYAHYKPTGGIFYIGKGTGKRAHSLVGRNPHWKQIVKKYGNPYVKILANWDTEQEAFDHEKLLISCFRKMGINLANITNGGDGNFGFKHSDVTKEKISKTHFGKKLSESKKTAIGIAKMGNKNPSFKGAIISTNILTGNQQTFIGAKELHNFGFDHSAVYKCINKKLVSYKGHIFKRIDKE